jgi:hypothetical protein
LARRARASVRGLSTGWNTRGSLCRRALAFKMSTIDRITRISLMRGPVELELQGDETVGKRGNIACQWS